MNKKTNNKLKLILGIILIVIIALCAIYLQFFNNQYNETTNIYSDINIDTSKLNILYFNVGQADSSLILYKDKVILIDAGNESDGEKIVIELTYKEQQYLFMGDAQKEVENKLLYNGLLEDIDVLKVGHHGSDTSTTENFLDKILPEISIISVQEGVKYDDMPNVDVLERLEVKSKVYRTDKDGTIWLTSDGKTNTITLLERLNLNGANKTAWRVCFKYALFKCLEIL